MCHMEELQEQLEITKKSLADSERRKRAAVREKKTLEDMNKRLAAETEASIDISGSEQERLLEKLQKNEELETACGTVTKLRFERSGRHAAATLSTATGFSAGGGTSGVAGGQLLRGREAKV